nr:vestigial [Triops longicaudatus]
MCDTMSCAQVMYQPYMPYLSYDRSANPAEDKKYRLHESSTESSFPGSYLLLGHHRHPAAAAHHSAFPHTSDLSHHHVQSPLVPPSQTPGPSSSSSASSSCGIAPSAAVGAPSSSSGSNNNNNNGSSSGIIVPPGPTSASTSSSLIRPGPSSSSNNSGHESVIRIKNDHHGEEEEEDQHKEAQYLSANCVLFTHYCGDVSSVVDEHFNRALSQEASFAESKGVITKAISPMSQRNFPPSFWDSNYVPQPPQPVKLTSYGHPQAASHHDLYSQAEAYHAAHAMSSLHSHHHHHPHHAHHSAEAWHYSLGSHHQAYAAAAAHARPSMSDLAGSYSSVSGMGVSGAAGRFAPHQYGSFLLQGAAAAAAGAAARIQPNPAAAAAHCPVKSEPWTPGRYPHEALAMSAADLSHPLEAHSANYATGHPHPYSNVPGLDAGGQVQEPGKDLYWF